MSTQNIYSIKRPTQAPSTCADTNRYCSDWAKRGECQKNAAYMNTNCKKSCNLCTGRENNCVDKSPYCQDWATNGECRKNPAYMLHNCGKSCRTC